jgi:uncharacterized membrane protein YhaH (DUF805 family)
MIKALLGEVNTGRLMRLQYLGYSLLLSLLMLGVGLTVAAAVGAGEQVIDGDLQQAQNLLSEALSGPFLLVFAVLMILFMFIGANIMAKRIRDIGLPGWWSVLAIFVLSGLLSNLVSANASNILNSVIWILLLLVPGNALVSGAQPQDGQ